MFGYQAQQRHFHTLSHFDIHKVKLLSIRNLKYPIFKIDFTELDVDNTAAKSRATAEPLMLLLTTPS